MKSPLILFSLFVLALTGCGRAPLPQGGNGNGIDDVTGRPPAARTPTPSPARPTVAEMLPDQHVLTQFADGAGSQPWASASLSSFLDELAHGRSGLFPPGPSMSRWEYKSDADSFIYMLLDAGNGFRLGSVNGTDRHPSYRSLVVIEPNGQSTGIQSYDEGDCLKFYRGTVQVSATQLRFTARYVGRSPTNTPGRTCYRAADSASGTMRRID